MGEVSDDFGVSFINRQFVPDLLIAFDFYLGEPQTSLGKTQNHVDQPQNPFSEDSAGDSVDDQ